MKKVAFLDYSMVFAGAERVLYNVIAHIDRTKYEPILVFPYPMDHQSRYADLDCRKVYLNKSKAWWMGSDRWEHPLRGTDFLKRTIFGCQIARLIRKEQIDILDVNLIRGDVMMWVWAARQFTNAKIVGHYRSQDLSWVAPATAQRLFDKIACVSKFSQGRFLQRGEFVKTEVVYDSVDVDVMKSDRTKSEAKALLGYGEEDILLVSVGQLSIRKGHDQAIKAFSLVAKEFPKAKLLVAGGGDDPMAEFYRKLAGECGVGDRVSVPGVQLTHIQDVYRAADLSLSLTKDGEGFGLVPYESVLLGTPFIAPCFGAVCEFVEDGKNGLLVDTNNVEAIAEKMRYALTHPDALKAMTDALRVQVYELLRPEVLASNLDQFYSSLFVAQS